MLKHLIYSLPAVLVIGCSNSSEKYRDLQHLEMPPALAIEHTNHQPVIEADDMKPKSSSLAGLLAFEDDGNKPVLTLKTRPERAWEMVATALKITDIKVLDKSREENHFQVSYDPDEAGKETSLLTDLFGNHYEEAEYIINLKEGSGGVVVNVRLSKPDELDSGDDGSAELLRLLNKTIDEKIINRDTSEKIKE